MEIFYTNEKPKNLVGKKVRELRLKQGMSHPELAARLRQEGVNIAWPSVVKIEAQVRNVTDIELVALAKIFNVRIDKLFC